ncbi:hypothetical protein DFH06DRAFT_1334384 [Mycena polygramma]|nr:hypothetical protein DFH06DRAFT_1334384 [Mycena polygramma]
MVRIPVFLPPSALTFSFQSCTSIASRHDDEGHAGRKRLRRATLAPNSAFEAGTSMPMHSAHMPRHRAHASPPSNAAPGHRIQHTADSPTPRVRLNAAERTPRIHRPAVHADAHLRTRRARGTQHAPIARLRHIRRWSTRNLVEVRVALALFLPADSFLKAVPSRRRIRVEHAMRIVHIHRTRTCTARTMRAPPRAARCAPAVRHRAQLRRVRA